MKYKKMVFTACQECPNCNYKGMDNTCICNRTDIEIEDPSEISEHCPLEDDN